MNSGSILSVALAGALLAGTGCTLPSSGRTLPSAQVGQLQQRAVATVIKVSEVTIEGRRTNLGQYGGAVIGGAAALPAGGVGGRGDAVTVAAASIIGAVAGEAVEEYATRKRAQELTVEMPNGDVFVIVQESPPEFRVGDKVHVISGPGASRVELALEF